MTPLVFLCSTIVITLGAAGMQGILRASERRKLRRLALEWKMNYCADDRFHLTDRLAAQLPVPGAADVDLSDIIYGSEGDGHRFLLTAEYTTGVVQAKKRRRQVCLVMENASSVKLIALAGDGARLERYRQLHVGQGN